MAVKARAVSRRTEVTRNYRSFDQLDGEHPWMKVVPNGFVPYRVRELGQGRVAYFNYVLAKEMGLIAADHPQRMNGDLEKKILQTFSLQIINEYDELSELKFDARTIKPKTFMASRYLQLQHPSRLGKTSGDGRGIWNGTAAHKGVVWDVSSRGTGVTCLAPGAVEAQRPLRTGDTDFGYGCGQAEIDELYGAAILAEILHLQGIATERMLCIIDLGKGHGIGVRAAPNLLRPAHLFLLLKQSRYKDLKAAVDYLIERQVTNSEWTAKLQSPRRYEEMLIQICDRFSKFIAQLDVDYIFAWLDWDGDNVLANAGIIDYGSVRQFGIRHDRYRYDDVERFSTTLSEQRRKARQIVQVFAQIVDYLVTGRRRPLKSFARHAILRRFDRQFKIAKEDRILYRMGFARDQRDSLKNRKATKAFLRIFRLFEQTKVSTGPRKLADGINHPALLGLRFALRSLPRFYVEHGFMRSMPVEQLFSGMLTQFARNQDRKLNTHRRWLLLKFQRLYRRILQIGFAGRVTEQIATFADRAEKLNRPNRMTGNALINIVEDLISYSKKANASPDVQGVIDHLILEYLDQPEVKVSPFYFRGPRALPAPDILAKILSHLDHFRHDI